MNTIEKITAKNQVNKIITAYRRYKKRNNNQTISQYTNDNMTTEMGSPEKEYIGVRDSRGYKQGFGIQKMKDGSVFRGIFINDKVSYMNIKMGIYIKVNMKMIGLVVMENIPMEMVQFIMGIG